MLIAVSAAWLVHQILYLWHGVFIFLVKCARRPAWQSQNPICNHLRLPRDMKNVHIVFLQSVLPSGNAASCVGLLTEQCFQGRMIGVHNHGAWQPLDKASNLFHTPENCQRPFLGGVVPLLRSLQCVGLKQGTRSSRATRKDELRR